MKNFNITRNYTQAIFAIDSDNVSHKRTLVELQKFYELLKNDEQIYQALISPIISMQDKINLLGKINDNMKFSKQLHQFLLLLIKNSRINYLAEIIDYYKLLLAKEEQIKLIDIISAQDLDKEQKIKITKFLEPEFGAIEINYIQEPALIGGFLVKYGDQQIDYSIKGALKILLAA